MPGKIIAEIRKRQVAFCQPALRLLRRDQVVIVAERLHRRVDCGVIRLAVLVRRVLVAGYQPQELLPNRLHFPPELRRVDDIAHRIRARTDSENLSAAVRRDETTPGHPDLLRRLAGKCRAFARFAPPVTAPVPSRQKPPVVFSRKCVILHPYWNKFCSVRCMVGRQLRFPHW